MQPPRKRDVVMDLMACHRNGCRLDLDLLLSSSDEHLMHDLSGIEKHIDRRTGKLSGFRPYSAAREAYAPKQPTNTIDMTA